MNISLRSNFHTVIASLRFCSARLMDSSQVGIKLSCNRWRQSFLNGSDIAGLPSRYHARPSSFKMKRRKEQIRIRSAKLVKLRRNLSSEKLSRRLKPNNSFSSRSKTQQNLRCTSVLWICTSIR